MTLDAPIRRPLLRPFHIFRGLGQPVARTHSNTLIPWANPKRKQSKRRSAKPPRRATLISLPSSRRIRPMAALSALTA